MKLVAILAASVFALSLPGASLYAQGRGNGQAKKTTQAPKHTARPTTKVETRAPKAEARHVKAETKHAKKGTRTLTTTYVSPSTPTSYSVKNPRLETRLLTLLPPGSNIHDASRGFKNWGQFVAAAHVSNNLNIPFAELKSRMTGIAPGSIVPTTAPMSLGQSIQSFKGTAPARETGTWSPTKIRGEVKRAEDAAYDDLRRSRDRS